MAYIIAVNVSSVIYSLLHDESDYERPLFCRTLVATVCAMI